MNLKRLTTLFVLGLLLTFSITIFADDEHTDDGHANDEHTTSAHGHSIHWSYSNEGAPENWGELDHKYVVCGTGHAQSPIHITKPNALDLSDIAFDYTPSTLSIINNGHTIQTNLTTGNTIRYNGIDYKLRQFHFHHPSEHTVDGIEAVMEVHFVHEHPYTGSLAVVGILFTVGEASNEAYQAIFQNMPTEINHPIIAETEFDLNALLPDNRSYTTYNGSLTTPPCTESVRWLVLNHPITLSQEQVNLFASYYEMNARPLQDRNNRDLLQDNN